MPTATGWSRAAASCSRRGSSTRTSTCAPPGREDEETITSGHRLRGRRRLCAILAMPNTEPVVDSAAVLGSLIETAREEAEVPVGFLASITKGQEGNELTEMAELADAGAAGFSDDGRPVIEPGLMRRALQYHAFTGLRVAPHCEEPTLSRGGQMHEGAVSAELGFAGYPSIAESAMVSRRSDDRGIRKPAHPPAAPLRPGVSGRLRSARSEGVRARGRRRRTICGARRRTRVRTGAADGSAGPRTRRTSARSRATIVLSATDG